MKKILSILIVGILALGLVACGSKQTTKNEEKIKSINLEKRYLLKIKRERCLFIEDKRSKNR